LPLTSQVAEVADCHWAGLTVSVKVIHNTIMSYLNRNRRGIFAMFRNYAVILHSKQIKHKYSDRDSVSDVTVFNVPWRPWTRGRFRKN